MFKVAYLVELLVPARADRAATLRLSGQQRCEGREQSPWQSVPHVAMSECRVWWNCPQAQKEVC